METDAATAARQTYRLTREAEHLGGLYRRHMISPPEEHRLLECVEQVADLTNRPSRVVWLEVVDGEPNAERTYAKELEGAEAFQRAVERRRAKQAEVRQRALAIIGMAE